MAEKPTLKSSGKTKKKKKASKKVKKDLDLDDVMKLGGTKEDYEMLQKINESDDNCSNTGEDIKSDEVQSLIESLGFKKAAPSGGKRTLSSKSLPKNFDWGEVVPNKEETKPKQKSKTKHKLESKNAPTETSQDSSQKKKRGRKKSKNKFKPQIEEPSSTKVKKNSVKNIQDNKISSTTVTLTVPKKSKKKQKKKDKKGHSNLVVEPGGLWYKFETETKSPDEDLGDTKTPQWTSVKSLESEAAEIFRKDIEKYKEKRNQSKPSETDWYEKVVSSGTLGDKQAALQLYVTESPVHNLNSFDSLIAMTQKKGRRECITASTALKDLLINNILPKNQSLMSFHQHKMHELKETTREKQLLLWYFESELKKRFNVFIESLIAMLQDNVDTPKEKALGIISELLAHTTEQEAILLTSLVNKVGDPNYKTASKTVYILSKFLKVCPSKKLLVIEEVEKLLCRPGMQQKGLYYAFCFLSNLRLKEGESKIAERLITIYFKFFQRFIKQGEVDSRMLSAILAGVNFAYPIIQENRQFIQEQMNTLYKVVHVVNFNTSLQVLNLLYQIMSPDDSLSDRFYMVLYRKMCDPALKSSNRQVHFLNLFFRAIKKDHSDARIKALVKRLIQICFYHSPPFICGSLCLLSEVLREKPNLLNLKQTADNQVGSDDEEHFKDVDSDNDVEDEPSKKAVYNSDSAGEVTDEPTKETPKESNQPHFSSWVHRKNLKNIPIGTTYMPYHRNPLYCQADTTSLWELRQLSFHYHPTVSLYASTLLNKKFIDHDGDPMQDYTLMRFLDRFVFKNPKKIDKPKSKSEPKKRQYVAKGIKLIPVNTGKYLEKEDEIPVEEKYLFQYFARKDFINREKGIFSDDEEVSDDEFDRILEGYEGVTKDKELDDFDFYGELGKQTGNKKCLKDDFSDSDDEGGNDESDEDAEFGNDFMSEFKQFDNDESDQNSDEDNNDEFDEENIRFSDDSDDDDREFGEPVPKMKKLEKHQKESKKNPQDISKLFIAAEEFSAILDENTSTSNLGSRALVNRDKASAKQLKWEQAREQWMKGNDWKVKKRRQGKWKKKNPGSSGTSAFKGKPKGVKKRNKLKMKK